jgi:hypothetical protein
MLKELNADQARFIALLARTARTQRDAVLGHVAEDDLGGATPGRGEHNPVAELGYEPAVATATQTSALRDALGSLSPRARQELYVLMRIGQGHLPAKKWHHGLAEADALGEDTVSAVLIEDADLHDHLAKGLYEIKLAPRRPRARS